MKKIVLASDLGGTNLRMSSIDREGNILSRIKVETPRSGSSEDIVNVIVSSAINCRELITEPVQVVAVAMAVPGTVDADNGIIRKAPNLPSLDGFDISAALADRLEIPCVLENDANAAAVGEFWLGASKEFKSSICITIGTGVGGGIIFDSKVLRGIDGTAGEIGHICVEPFGYSCGCGSIGCVEQYASATAVVAQAKMFAADFPDTTIDIHKSPGLTAREIYEAGSLGDKLAIKVFRLQGFYLGLALAGLVNVLNPEAIVICGGGANSWNLFISELKRIIHERTYKEPGERVKILRGETGDDAGVLGVAHLAFENVLKLK